MPVSLRKNTDNDVEHILTGGDNGNTIIVSYSITKLSVTGPQTYPRLLCYLVIVDSIVAGITCLSYVPLPVLRLTRNSWSGCIVTWPTRTLSHDLEILGFYCKELPQWSSTRDLCVFSSPQTNHLDTPNCHHSSRRIDFVESPQ